MLEYMPTVWLVTESEAPIAQTCWPTTHTAFWSTLVPVSVLVLAVQVAPPSVDFITLQWHGGSTQSL